MKKTPAQQINLPASASTPRPRKQSWLLGVLIGLIPLVLIGLAVLVLHLNLGSSKDRLIQALLANEPETADASDTADLSTQLQKREETLRLAEAEAEQNALQLEKEEAGLQARKAEQEQKEVALEERMRALEANEMAYSKTIDMVDAMAPDKAAELLTGLDQVQEAASIISQLSPEAAAKIMSHVETEKAVAILEQLIG